MSLAAAQRAAQGIDKALAQEAWNAGKEIAGGKEAGSKASDDGGKRNAGMDPGKQAGAVAEGAGRAKTRSAAGRAVAERIELENRVRAAGQPYLSGKDIGLSKGSAQRSFREAPERTWTDGMKAAAGTLKRAGFTEVHFTAGSIGVENQKAKVTRYVDGVAMGDTVWVNATAKKWPAEQIANHEAFHRQVQDAPYLMDSVRSALADELGEDGLRELAQKYAEAYEGCYDAEELDAYIEEVCADAYAGMDRLPEERTRIIQKAAQRAQEAQQAAEENGGTRGPPEKYSVVTLPDGKQFVKADRMVLFGNDPREWRVQLEDYINGKIRRGEDVTLIGADGDELVLTATSAGKLSSPYTNDGRTMSDAAYELKETAAAHIDELVSVSNRKGAVKTDRDGRHGEMAADGWAYRTAYFEDFDGKYYQLTISAARNASGTMVYNIGNMKEEASPKVKGSSAGNGNGPRGFASSENSIRSQEQKVNEKFSADGSTATPQENDKTALAYFGRTYKWSETGYVLLNGARLDFSGRHEGGSGGYRSVDHRDITDALGEDYGGGDYTGGMVRFMQEGNIRISPESGGINLAVMPTKAQMDSLSDFISKERGEVILDIDDASGNTISSTAYPRGTHANKVLQDIRNYFNDGTLPEVSTSPSVSQFRYSVSDLGTEAEGAAAFTLDSIPKKAQDYLRRVRGQTAAAIQQTLSMPFAARQEVLKPAIEQMMNEYLQTGRISQETIDQTFDASYARGVEMDTEFYDQYKDVKTRLRDLKVTLSEADRADIADFGDFRRAASGRLRIANEGGIAKPLITQCIAGAYAERGWCHAFTLLHAGIYSDGTWRRTFVVPAGLGLAGAGDRGACADRSRLPDGKLPLKLRKQPAAAVSRQMRKKRHNLVHCRVYIR